MRTGIPESSKLDFLASLTTMRAKKTKIVRTHHLHLPILLVLYATKHLDDVSKLLVKFVLSSIRFGKNSS